MVIGSDTGMAEAMPFFYCGCNATSVSKSMGLPSLEVRNAMTAS
jgi:hypothetical protein